MTQWFGTVLQVLVLASAFYYLFLLFRGTRGAQVLVGMVLLLVGLTVLTQVFNLDVLNWLLSQISVLMGLAVLVIFQPEIRRALAELGRPPAFTAQSEQREVLDPILQATAYLAEHKVGALIAIEREITTAAVQESGVRLDARLTNELLATIFFPHTPLHDGGVIIRGNRILAAGCVFPMDQDPEAHRSLGTRHRAAVGISAETDAVVVVVSEETGTISLCYRGRMIRGMDEHRLRRHLSALLLGRRPDGAWRRMRARLAGLRGAPRGTADGGPTQREA